jgi:hypothetical protein
MIADEATVARHVTANPCGVSIVWQSGLLQDKKVINKTLGCHLNVPVRCAGLNFVF